MAKCIKRAGLVFFAIVLSLLLFIGIILTLNATNSNENFSDLENDDIQTVADKQYDLTGDTYAKKDLWNEAVAYSVDNKKSVEVKLLSDWTSVFMGDGTQFGYGNGFTAYGGIFVPEGANIILNLNDNSIIANNIYLPVITVEGNLELKHDGYTDYKGIVLSGSNIPDKNQIKGASLNNGSSIIVVNGANAYFKMNGGWISQNTMSSYGSINNYGFLKIENGANAELIRGAFCNNRVSNPQNSNQKFSAVLITGNSQCIIEDIVIKETNTNMGGVFVESGSITLGRANGYIYGSTKYDIDLNGTKLKFTLGDAVTGTFGIAVAPGQIFTSSYSVSQRSRNPINIFKFNKMNTYVGDYYPIVDDSTGDVKFVAKSQMKLIAKPTRGTTDNYIKTYNGGWQTFIPAGFDDNAMTITGNHTGGVGIHKAKINLKAGYLWKDNYGYEEFTLEWQIKPLILEKPTLEIDTFVYDGEWKRLTYKNYVYSYFNESGEYLQRDVGTYVVTISLKSTTNLKWKDNTTTPISFEWSITEKPIEKPVTGENIFIFNNSAYEYVPEGFVSSQMTISGNIQTAIGKYTAIIALKPNYKWADDTKTALEYRYTITHPGIVVEDNLNWDYLYLQNNFRKTYSSNNYYHKINDNNIALANGKTRYVLGNIKPNTQMLVLLNNLLNDINLIKIYNQYDNIIYDGITSNGEIAESVGKQVIGTGYKVELYENVAATTAFDTVYLSVLGDINGDGRITAMDLLVINQMAKDDNILNSMEVEYQLAAMVNNKGGITSVDSEILNNVMSGELDLNLFINAEINENTNYTYLILNKENGKYERVVSETATNVIGNISIGTKVSEFKTKLATLGVNTAQIAIYNNQDTQVTDDNAIVGTGWYYKINGSQRTYISVLGDLNGDGRISASDMMYLNQIINGNKENIDDCIMLSAIILNTGKITSADVEVLRDNIENFTALIAY